MLARLARLTLKIYWWNNHSQPNKTDQSWSQESFVFVNNRSLLSVEHWGSFYTNSCQSSANCVCFQWYQMQMILFDDIWEDQFWILFELNWSKSLNWIYTEFWQLSSLNITDNFLIIIFMHFLIHVNETGLSQQHSSVVYSLWHEHCFAICIHHITSSECWQWRLWWWECLAVGRHQWVEQWLISWVCHSTMLMITTARRTRARWGQEWVSRMRTDNPGSHHWLISWPRRTVCSPALLSNTHTGDQSPTIILQYIKIGRPLRQAGSASNFYFIF